MLSEYEIIVLSKLRNWQRFWLWGRWCVLIAGLFSVAGGLWLMLQIVQRAEAGLKLDLETVLVCLVSSIMLVCGMLSVTYSMARWRGDPFSKLLLGLLEKEEREAESERGHPLEKEKVS